MFNFIRPAFYFKFSPFFFFFFILFISLRKRKFLSKLIKHEWVPALKDFVSEPKIFFFFFFSLLLFYNFLLFCFIANFSFKLYLMYSYLLSILGGFFPLFFFFTFLLLFYNHFLLQEKCSILYDSKNCF